MWEHQGLPIVGDDADAPTATKRSSAEAKRLVTVVHEAVIVARLVSDSE